MSFNSKMGFSLGTGFAVRSIKCLAVALAATVMLRVAPNAMADDGGAVIISGESSPFRFHVTLSPAMVPTASGEEKMKIKVAYRSYPGIEKIETEPPTQGWQAPEFDDSNWARATGALRLGGRMIRSVFNIVALPGLDKAVAEVSIRGRFNVTNPAAVQDGELLLDYRGGAIVYLNGKEIARKDVVDSGGRRHGAAYDKDAWVGEDGKLLEAEFRMQAAIKKGDKDKERRLELRSRSLGAVKVPASALRKGVNVLAVQLLRSPYPAEAANGVDWVPIALNKLELRLPGDGVQVNVARPEGFQVWTQDVNDRTIAYDFADPNEALRPVVLTGARNGAFSGVVVVGSSSEIKGLKASVSDLKGKAGSIASKQAEVWWGVLDGLNYKTFEWFDGLTRKAPESVPVFQKRGATQPVLFSVRVPADAAAGEYAGAVTLEAEGMPPVAVPVRLEVRDWTIPNPRDFRTYVGVYQSPTTLALHYGVPEWSEEHWRLMDRSFELLGLIGNNIVNIPVVENTQFGNGEGMVLWVKEANGAYTYDFGVFDRFLDLTEKHLGAPDVVALQIWHSGGWEVRKADQQNTVTVLDKATGKRYSQQVPVFDSAEAREFWKPVLDQIRARLEKRKMEKSMAIGILSDGTAPATVFQMFDEIIPGGAYWTRGCHSVTRAHEPYRASRLGGGKVVLHEFCYGMAMADPDAGLPPIWKQRGKPGTAYVRHNFDDTLSLLKYKTFAERALFCGTRGIGRTCLDFWAVETPGKTGKRRVFNQYPFSSCGQREPNMWRLGAPGPDGAEPTFRFMQLLEGIQTAEALIVVAEAQGEPDKAEVIGAELAAKARQIYLDRLNYARRHAPGINGVYPVFSPHAGWQELDRRVYDLAGEVQRKLKP